jgi:hypothetical protein
VEILDACDSSMAEFSYDALGKRIEKKTLLTPTILGGIIMTTNCGNYADVTAR